MPLEQHDLPGIQFKKIVVAFSLLGQDKFVFTPAVGPQIAAHPGAAEVQHVGVAGRRHAAPGQFLRRHPALQQTLPEDQDLVRHQAHLPQRMADEEQRNGELRKNLLQIGDDLVFQLPVEAGQGLVHKDQLRTGQDGAAQGHPLPFAPG